MIIDSHLPINPTLIVAGISWFVAQALKFIFLLIKDKRVDFTRFVGSGGMPSSHTSLCTAMAVSVGRLEGWNSVVFAVACVFTAVVMYDAAGVRRAAGEQAKVLNELMYSHFDSDQISKRLKELLGHTPLEVFAGAILGITLGFLL